MPQRRTLSRLERLLASEPSGPWSRRQLVDAGWSPQQIDRSLASGILCRVRRGMYDVPPEHAVARSFDDRAQLRAHLERLAPRASLSHESAAAVYALWVPWPGRSGVQVTISGQAERRDKGLTVHGSRLPEQFVLGVDGLRVTSPARTAMDLGRGRSLPAAMVAVDGAARFLLGARDRDVAESIRRRQLPQSAYDDVSRLLEEAFAVVWSWPGTRVLRQALDLMDCASESPLESESRGHFVLAQLPAPLIGWPVRGASGKLYFVDFLWKDAGVIGEADGFQKYGESAEEQRRAYRDQRRRQDDLEAAGWRFVRWTTGEPGPVIVARVARTLGLRPATRRAS